MLCSFAMTLSSNSDKRASQLKLIVSGSYAASVCRYAICHNFALRYIKEGWCYAKLRGY